MACDGGGGETTALSSLSETAVSAETCGGGGIGGKASAVVVAASAVAAGVASMVAVVMAVVEGGDLQLHLSSTLPPPILWQSPLTRRSNAADAAAGSWPQRIALSRSIAAKSNASSGGGSCSCKGGSSGGTPRAANLRAISWYSRKSSGIFYQTPKLMPNLTEPKSRRLSSTVLGRGPKGKAEPDLF